MAATDDDEDQLNLEGRRRDLERQLIEKGALKDPQAIGSSRDIQGGNEKTQLGQAVKLASEFLAAVVVGVVLGLGFDQVTGWSPWGLIVFLFLGFAAGVLNMLRAVGYVEPHRLGRHSDDQAPD